MPISRNLSSRSPHLSSKTSTAREIGKGPLGGIERDTVLGELSPRLGVVPLELSSLGILLVSSSWVKLSTAGLARAPGRALSASGSRGPGSRRGFQVFRFSRPGAFVSGAGPERLTVYPPKDHATSQFHPQS
jgi:hypothetical protein